MANNNFLINTRNKANEALRRPANQRAVTSANELYPALVTEVNADGSIDVVTVDSGGGTGQHYENLVAHPRDTVVAKGDSVWVWMPANGESPIILSAGGGGQSCMRGITDWAPYFG